MSLTKEQKQDLGKLSTYFEKIEQLAAKNGIDLDVFMSEYKDDGYAVYATENIEIKDKTDKRKKVFEKAGKEKSTEKHPVSKGL
ncbi:MAG: hypothetical protein NT126_04110 [Bacteroidetes bacterium]|nr:hypothetical protein [Bacteroidota bacterium]